MNLQKKLLAVVASGLLVFGVAACEGDSTTVDDTTVDDTTTDLEPTDELVPTEDVLDPTESATE